MWLKLDLEGISFEYRISEYEPSTNQNWDTNWCKVDLTIRSGNWLDYRIEYKEILLAAEVENLRDGINKLLNDELNEPQLIEGLEPDLEFHLHPKEDKRNNPRISYVRPGYEIIDVDMQLIITFWNIDKSLSENKMILCFNRDELEKLLCYLNLVTGVISENDLKVKRYINEGCLH